VSVISIRYNKGQLLVKYKLIFFSQLAKSALCFVSYTDNRNILISFFGRTFSSDSLVFIFEEKYVAILDKIPSSEFVDSNTIFYGLITNKDTIVSSHIDTFEKIWLLEKAVNM
jgi:hypothetical protein